MLTDTHIHLDFYTDRELPLLLEDARQRGVLRWVIPAVKEENWSRLNQLADAYPDLSCCYGWHPAHLPANSSAVSDRLTELKRLLEESGVAAGECGLERNSPFPLEYQQEVLSAQVSLANRLYLPVVFHFHAPWDRVFNFLENHPPERDGVVHGFSGSPQIAHRLVDSGLYIGVNGLVTVQRARKLRESVVSLPLERLLCETDAPDRSLSSGSRRGLPQDLRQVVQEIALLRGEPYDEVAAALEENCRRFFSPEGRAFRL